MNKLLLILSLFPSIGNSVELPIVPNKSISPGDVNHEVTVTELCIPNYTKGLDKHGNKVRDVPESIKRKVFEEYHLSKKDSEFEIDHIVSLVLGGSNDIKNLFPQSYVTKPFNAHHKDALEVKLHKLVCSGKMSLEQAQSEISNNWIEAYKKYVKKELDR